MAVIDDLKKNLGQKVVLSLRNGEKSGTILEIEEFADPPSILFQEPTGASRSIAIPLIFMVESAGDGAVVERQQEIKALPVYQAPVYTPAPEPVKPAPEPQFVQSNQEVLAYRIRIESTYDAQSKAAHVDIFPPDFSTPPEIRGLNYGNSSEEPRDWTFIKNKYDNARRTGKLSPQSEDLREIINRCRKLTEHSTLHKSPVFHGYLGYFSYLNGAKQDAILALQKAAKLSDHPQDWNNLAAVALELNETELACIALARMFMLGSPTDTRFEKAWYKFSELANRFSYFSSLEQIANSSNGRMILKEEFKRMFETVCYCLIKQREPEKADQLISAALQSDDYYNLLLRGVGYLPKELAVGFSQYKANFDRMTVTYVPPVQVSKPAYQTPKATSFAMRDSDLHKEASRAGQQKDFEKAERLYREAIDKNINRASAIRDLAMLLDQLKRTEEAVELLEKKSDKTDQDKQIMSVLYHKLKKFEKSIHLKEELYNNYVIAVNAKNTKDSITAIRNKRITMLSEIARGYFGLEQFDKAAESYKKALTFSPNDHNIRRNIAICQYKNGEIALATKELSALVQDGDNRSMELLQAIENPVDTNAPNVDIIIANLISQRSTDLGQFTQFYLDRCAYKGVPPERMENGRYTATDKKDLEVDMDRLENAAKALGTARPGERSEFMLSLSKIIFDSQSNDPYFYRYLCRHFTSKADSAIYEGKAMDTVKTFYLEALKVFDPYTEEKSSKRLFDEQDAVNAMYRYIYAQLGAGEVPLEAILVGTVDKQKMQVHDACEKAFNESFKSYGNYDRILDAIRLLIATSPLYGSRRLLQILHEEPQWLEMSVEYLRQLVEQTQIQSKPNFEEFAKAWQEAATLLLERENEVASQINLLRQFSLSNAWLTEAALRIDNLLLGRFSFELDKEYLRKLGVIIDDCITYQNANGFDDRIGRSSDLENKCRKLMEDIEKNPTKHAIEDIYEVIGNIRSVLAADIDRFYEDNKPSLTFDSAVNNYVLKEDQSLDVQIIIQNTGAGHAEQIELEILTDPNLFKVTKGNTISHGTVRAGAEETIMVNFIPTEFAKTAKGFSFLVDCKYKTRRGDPMETTSDPISVQIGSDEDFIPIKPNPYAEYAKSAIVDNVKMFYGRQSFIDDAFEIICNNYKSFAISGQKRAGKSSVLHHLGNKLRENEDLLVIDVGNIGRLIDLSSKIPLIYQLLWTILDYTNEELIKTKEYKEIIKHIPSYNDFYNHPTPILYFERIISQIKSDLKIAKRPKNRIIVLIDEFTYVYELIVKVEYTQNLGVEFLKNWKALLEKKLFSVVLVAQDFFNKLIDLDRNSFAMVEHKRISYLELEHAKLLIDQPIQQDGATRYTDSAIRRIFDLTAGSPFYIQIFCNQLVNYVNKEKVITITEANVNTVLKNYLLKGNSRLEVADFDNLIGDGDPAPDAIEEKDSMVVLKEISKHTKNQPYCNVAHIECKTDSPITNIIQRLIDREVLEGNTDGLIRISVGLFKEWLLEN